MENEQIRQVKDVASNKQRLKSLEGYVGSIDKNVKELDEKFDNLNIEFAKLSTKITSRQSEHEKVLSIRIWLISLLISAGISTAGLIIKFLK
jgi:chromosome segregation ATPase